jgi:surface polysaccharide O-acyltransferase-like enzyme
VDCACRWAVPVYIMLSGSLLLDPDRAEEPSQFYRKRLWRLGIPVVFWSAFFMWLSVEYTGWRTWDGAVTDLMFGKPYAHLHFIFRIMGLYAFTPMLRVFLKHASRRMVALTVVILLVLAAGNSLLDGWTGSEQSAFLRFAPFMGYYLAGYLMRDQILSARALRGCWLLAIACVLILAGGTGLLASIFGVKPYPSLGMLLYDFTSPVRVAFAIAAWLIVVNTFDQKWFESKFGRFVTKWLAPATLGIYLVHPAFREILHMNGFDATRPNVWLGVPLMAVLVYLPSVVFTLIVMRIPFVKRIVG